MNMIVTTEEQKQMQNAIAVRNRLLNPKPKADVYRDRIAELEEELASIRSVRVKRMEDLVERERRATYKVEQLELDVADLHARILAQAKKICEMDGLMEQGTKRSVDEIVAGVLKSYPGISWEDVKGVRRARKFVNPRQACMYAVYTERSDLSLPQVGRLFGGKDHTTILHAVRKIEAAKNGAK